MTTVSKAPCLAAPGGGPAAAFCPRLIPLLPIAARCCPLLLDGYLSIRGVCCVRLPVLFGTGWLSGFPFSFV